MIKDIKPNMSIIENLENIQNLGKKEFLKNEKIKWNCSKYGGTICVHKGFCFSFKEQ